MSDAVLVGIIAAIPASLIGLANLIQQIKTHSSVNSKMDAMLALARKDAFADGQKQEKASNEAERASFNAGQLKAQEIQQATKPAK